MTVKAVFIPHLGRRFIGVCDTCGWATGRRAGRIEAEAGIEDHAHLEHAEVSDG